MLCRYSPLPQFFRRFSVFSDRGRSSSSPVPRVLTGPRCLLAALCWLALGGPATAQAAQDVTDENVEAAISKAIQFIKSQRNNDHWETSDKAKDRNWAGKSALAILSLLYAGENPRQDDMADSLKWLVKQNMTGTYAIGVRTHALSLIPGREYRQPLEKDVKWLLDAVYPTGSPDAGGYGYVMRTGMGGRTDHSVDQFGVLGVWMASDAGLRVPDDYWLLVENHWLDGQLAGGGWAYQKKGGGATGSMTAAGLATLFVTLDKAHGRDEGAFNGRSSAQCGLHKQAERLLTSIDRALGWFSNAFSPSENPGGGQWYYYYLYGVERIGRASGKKYFGDRDWFKEGAKALLARQQPDGSWRGSIAELEDTSFSLMFLSHGRAPLLFSKLQHGDDWNNKLRDVAGLTRYAEKRFERLLNWQIVNLKAPLADLLEAPILYMSGHNAWEFTDEEAEKLRAYCNRGGMILAVSCCSSTAFSEGFKRLAARLFPDFPMTQVPADRDLIGSVLADLQDPPKLLEVHNGVRTLIVHTERDICAPWNQNRSRGKWEPYFELGSNLYLYATDKTSIRSRLQTPDIPFRQTAHTGTIKVARMKHGGLWDPEPYGWERLRIYMNNETGRKLEVISGVTFDELDPKKTKIAHVTGTGKFQLDAAERKGLIRFITRGGTLIADAAGGSREFADSFEQVISEVLKMNLKYLQKDSFLLRGQGVPDAVSLANIGVRRTARGGLRGRTFPRIKSTAEPRTRLSVLFIPMDISAGLLGTQVYNCRGYDADSSLRIAQTLLLYADLSRPAKAKLAKGRANQFRAGP